MQTIKVRIAILFIQFITFTFVVLDALGSLFFKKNSLSI